MYDEVKEWVETHGGAASYSWSEFLEACPEANNSGIMQTLAALRLENSINFSLTPNSEGNLEVTVEVL